MYASAAIGISLEEMSTQSSLEEGTAEALPSLLDDFFLAYNGVIENGLKGDTLVKVNFAEFSQNYSHNLGKICEI